jgi:hypothetical protein
MAHTSMIAHGHTARSRRGKNAESAKWKADAVEFLNSMDDLEQEMRNLESAMEAQLLAMMALIVQRGLLAVSDPKLADSGRLTDKAHDTGPPDDPVRSLTAAPAAPPFAIAA